MANWRVGNSNSLNGGLSSYPKHSNEPISKQNLPPNSLDPTERPQKGPLDARNDPIPHMALVSVKQCQRADNQAQTIGVIGWLWCEFEVK